MPVTTGRPPLGPEPERLVLAEAFPHRRQGAQASLELVRLGGVAGPDAGLQLVQAFQLPLHQGVAFLLGTTPQFSQERHPGVAGPLQADGAGDGGEGAALLAQRQRILVDVATWPGATAGLALAVGVSGAIGERPIGAA